MTYIYDRKDDFRFVRWAQEVKTRDHHTCQICGRRGLELNSHHILSWDKNVDDRFDIENGITLCRYHHDTFHDIYGRGNNTEEQFEEFKQIQESLMQSMKLKLDQEKFTNQIIRNVEIDLILENVDGYNSSI